MRRKRLLVWLGILGLIGVAGPVARAEIKPHALISDGMVLQRDMSVPIWGTATDEDTVTVALQGQKVSATVKDGKWKVRLDKLEAGGPFEMTIAGKQTLHIQNVLVGEVWVCSGQSNMEWPLQKTANAEEVVAGSKDPMLHLFTVPRLKASTPQENVKGSWQECGPRTVPNFSAVAYYFGRDLRKALGVPVGLIHTSWGGTKAELWTSRAALDANPELKGLPGSELYNGMIAPLIPYAIRGAIWYQGESNAGRAYQYRTLFPAMIRNWRESWKQGDFPFLFVQLASFKKIEPEPKESDWAELREAQLLTSERVPNTAMAVITDVGDEKDIHPKRKGPVGERLARAALALAYGKKIEYIGPRYDSMKVEGSKAILTFKHVGGGLTTKDGALKGFAIAGPDRKLVNAEAEIQGDHVVVSSPMVTKPVAVRYGWANYPTGNLWNKDGLPASPFRTDDFPLTTMPKTTPKAPGAK